MHIFYQTTEFELPFCNLSVVVYLFSCKTCHKQEHPCHKQNTRILKNFGVDLIIKDLRVGTFWGTKKVSKSLFTFISQKAFTKEKVIGTLD